MGSYKVTYFQARGGGEIIRLTLIAAGQEFEDERLSREQWQVKKPSTPMKAMPLLTIKNGGKETTFCQSGSCAKYIARKHGLLGSTPEEDLLIDEVFESLQDTLREMIKGMYGPTEEAKKEAQKKFAEEALPKFVEYFEKRSKEYGKNGFVIGGKMTLADIVVFNLFNQMDMKGQGAVWNKFSSLKKHNDQIKADKKIAAWLAKRPESDF